LKINYIYNWYWYNRIYLLFKHSIKQFYWDRDVKKSSIKVVSYSKNHLEHSSDFSKLEIEYPDLAYGFN